MQFRTAHVYIRVSKYTHISVQYTMIIQCIFKTELLVTNLKFCSESSLLKNSWSFFLLALPTVKRLHIRHYRLHSPKCNTGTVLYEDQKRTLLRMQLGSY